MFKNWKYGWLLVVLAIVTIRVTAAGAQSLRITSPVEGQRFSPGETITVAASVDTGTQISAVALGYGLMKDWGDVDRVNSPPFTRRVRLPDNRIGPVEIIAVGLLGDTVVKTLTLNVEIHPTSNLKELEVEPVRLRLRLKEDAANISVHGKFEDGTRIALENSQQGTTFQTKSGAFAVVSVDEAGNVDPMGTGTDVIVVRNDIMGRKVEVEIPVVVYEPAPERDSTSSIPSIIKK